MQLNGQKRQTRRRHDGTRFKKQNFIDGQVAIATNIYLYKIDFFLQEREKT